MSVDIKESFEKTRIAGSIAASTLDEVAKIIKPGITTDEINNLCYEFINDHGAYSAPLFYRGFPKSCCTSVNHVVCHGIPSSKILKEGDILNVDVTAYKDSWHGDTGRMFEVGKTSIKAKKSEITYAIANITIFGLFAMLLYPILANFLFNSDIISVGLFIGSSIHETAQVAGSSLIYSDQYSDDSQTTYWTGSYNLRGAQRRILRDKTASPTEPSIKGVTVTGVSIKQS